MADKNEKLPGQPPGPFYIDEQCIDCGICRDMAPENVGIDEDAGYSLVIKQPANDTEETALREVMDGCPVDAVGDDG